MLHRIVALAVALAVPASASAGPLMQSAEGAAREAAAAQTEDTRSRGRFWAGVGLLAGGSILAALGGLEIGDDETGPDDGEDIDDSDDGEDSDGWGHTALLGGGIAAATIGGVLLMTGRRSGPLVSARPGRVSVRHTIRF